MAPFDTPYATFYWSAIVNITLSCTVFSSYLTLYNTLKSRLDTNTQTPHNQAVLAKHRAAKIIIL